MKGKLKPILAVLLIVLVVVGWYAAIVGLGPVKPLKENMQLGLDIKGGVYVVLEAQDVDKYDSAELRQLMEQSQAVVTKRVDAMGLANPNVTIEGTKRLRIELPGVEDADEAIEQIGKTAQLKFTLADQSFVMDGSNVKDAAMGTDQQKGGYVVNLQFDSEGAKAFEEATTKASSGQVTSTYPENAGVLDNAVVILLDDEIISAPKVEQTISGDGCEIYGSFTKEEASNLAALIRGGSLPLEMKEITSSVQTATIGFDALQKSIVAGLIGLGLVFLIMLLGYRLIGLVADFALTMYVLIVLLVMAFFGSVLNLPGIAGIILAIGMAVDSNVVIFARIREEIVGGKSVRTATEQGFKRALGTVIDSQVTTLIAAVILYQIGTSSVKGFAFTLMLGIIVSIFTAVVVTQLYLNIIAQSERFGKPSFFGIKKDGTPTLQIKRQIKFVENRKIFYIISCCIIIAGLLFAGIRGFNQGIDFSGGTMFQIDLGKHVSEEQIKKVLAEDDLDVDIVYAGDNGEQAIIRTTTALNNEQRTEVLEHMQKEFKFDDDDVLAMELFGPSVGKELTRNAIKAVLLAALGMLIYIRLRFSKWKFGAAAILGLVHDVLFVLTFYAVFRVTINNPFIAAILTVVGYSINDTIVTFDRIRENNRFMRKGGLREIVDKSVNQTLSRSIMTSLTTIAVMIPLLIMAGPSLREFVLPLMVGVLVGCYSSIFICSPVYYDMAMFRSGSDYQRRQAKLKKGDSNDPYKKAKAEKAESAERTSRLKDDDYDPEAVGNSESGDLYIPQAKTAYKKTDVYKGKKKQSRAVRKKKED